MWGEGGGGVKDIEVFTLKARVETEPQQQSARRPVW